MESGFDLASMLAAIEQWPLAQAVKSSSLLYPAINAGHIVGLMAFFASVAIMDLRLLGAFDSVAPKLLLRSVRRVTVAAFAVVASTGALMFLAEPTSLALNPVFKAKLALVGIGLLNALTLEFALAKAISESPPREQLPLFARASAMISLGLWLCVAVAGCFIAYV